MYLSGRWSGWLWSRTLTVSKGYSMYLPAMPATYVSPSQLVCPSHINVVEPLGGLTDP